MKVESLQHGDGKCFTSYELISTLTYIFIQIVNFIRIFHFERVDNRAPEVEIVFHKKFLVKFPECMRVKPFLRKVSLVKAFKGI